MNNFSRSFFTALLFFFLYLGVSGIPFLFSPEASQHTNYFSHGVSLAFTILYGPVVTLGTFFAQLILSLSAGTPFPDALVLAEIFALTALAEGLIFRRLKCSRELTSHRDTLILLVLILFIFQPAAVLSAHLMQNDSATGVRFFQLIRAWFGVTNGQVLITPLILLGYNWYRTGMDWEEGRTALLWSAVACLLTVILFFVAGSFIPKGYKILTLSMLFPFFIMLSLRCSFLVVCAALVSSAMAAFFMPMHDSVFFVSPLFPYRDQVHFFLLGLNVTALLVVSFSQSERRMRARLESSENRFRMLFQNMSQAFVFGKITDERTGGRPDFLIILMNDLFAKLIGYKITDITGRSFSDLLPSAGPEVLEKFWKVARTGVPFEREYFTPVLNKYVKVSAYSPEQDHVAVLLEDISERVQAQHLLKAREQEFRSAFYGSNIGVGIVDVGGNFKQVNDQLCVITGYSKQELETTDIRAITHPEDREISGSYIDRALKFGEERARFEKRYIHKNGEVIHCLVAISLVKDHGGRAKFFIGHVQDITLLKAQAERINRDNEKLARLNEMKHTFISVIGHDLRNPVGSIRTLSRIARNGMRDGKGPEVAELLDMLVEQSEQTYILLSDLVEWAKIQSRETFFRYEEISFPALFESEIAALRFQCADKEIKVEYQAEGDVCVAANHQMVRTVLRNLISNAIKFSFPGGRIEISARGREEDVLICVRDFGCGIPADIRDAVFCPFSRISTPGTRNERGIGFGLPMCKEFVDQHGGAIWFESEEGGGTRFYVTFPRGLEHNRQLEQAESL